jgi:colanic acid/amylovoran biosynthesis protein
MSQGICCIGTSWSHKYELLYEEYRARDLLIEPDISVERLHHVIDLSLEKDNQTYQSIAVISLELKAKSVTMWSDFQSIAEDYPPFKEQRRV